MNHRFAIRLSGSNQVSDSIQFIRVPSDSDLEMMDDRCPRINRFETSRLSFDGAMIGEISTRFESRHITILMGEGVLP